MHWAPPPTRCRPVSPHFCEVAKKKKRHFIMNRPTNITSLCLGVFRSNHISMIDDNISHMMKYFTSYFLQQSCGCFRQISTFKLFSRKIQNRLASFGTGRASARVEGTERGGFVIQTNYLWNLVFWELRTWNLQRTSASKLKDGQHGVSRAELSAPLGSGREVVKPSAPPS